MPELHEEGDGESRIQKDTMAKTNFNSVDEYIATHPEDVQLILRRVRSTIRKALPDAEEVISYQIPAYKLRGRPVLYFAGWKQHYSLYPLTNQIVEAFKDHLPLYEVSKGTIRFPFSRPVPVKLIAGIAKLRAAWGVSVGASTASRDSDAHD